MTVHLSDDQFNEILDDRAGEAARRHLDACAECRARLAELQVVFTALEALPEQPLRRDLTASVLARLPEKRRARAWSWTLAIQSALAVFLLAFLAREFGFSTDALLPQLTNWLSAIQIPTFALPSFNFTMIDFQLPSFDFELSSFNLTILFASAALLWLVGNFSLLRGNGLRTRK
ncbi:MAG: anti-sigma factor family protein [Chloroflexota bacterium]